MEYKIGLYPLQAQEQLNQLKNPKATPSSSGLFIKSFFADLWIFLLLSVSLFGVWNCHLNSVTFLFSSAC